MPSSMKTALLTSIHKSGNPLEYAHYRGISLLSCLFKIITGTLNGWLQPMLQKHTGIDTNQGANRKGVHAAHKAAVLMNIIADARTNKKPLYIIYTDIKGAFPSVPYQAFTDALTSLGLSGPLLDLIHDTQHNFTVIARGPTGYSSERPKVSKVHEGDFLSPTLFCLVLNMFLIWVASQNLGYNMEGTGPENERFKTRVSVNGYADDMALVSKSAAEATTILHMLERFLAYYGMELNASKCAYQYQTEDPLYRPTSPTCRWGNIPIYHDKTSYKYLGYYIHTQLNFTYQFQQMVQKLEADCASFYSNTL
jgi:hypothetical protein